MSSPPGKYVRHTDFTDFSTAHPDEQQPGVDLDVEFDGIKATTDATINRLAEIQRDDGKLANQSVHKDSLDRTTLALMAGTGVPRGDWATGTIYAAKDLVTENGVTYIAVIAHTAGTFAVDLAAGKWLVFSVGADVAYAFSTTSELLSVFSGAATPPAGTVAVTGARSVFGDGGGGTFQYDAADTTTVDNGGTVRVDDQGRRWKLVLTGAITPRLFGVISPDATDTLQKTLDYLGAAGGGTLQMDPVEYVISGDLAVPSNVTIDGRGATLTGPTWASLGTFFDVSDSADVEIRNLTIDGQGEWTGTPFANPYEDGNSVGFTNQQRGISGINSSDIRVMFCKIKGVERAINPTVSSGWQIVGNTFTNLGMMGVYTDLLSNSIISDNVFDGVHGNMTEAGVTDIAMSKFADAVYIYRCNNVVVCDNPRITNCRRGGVTFEGDAITLNHLCTVNNNTITNMNSNRGTEFNYAIWFETGKSDDTCSANNNLCDNTGATAGTNASWGIAMYGGGLASGNKVFGFDMGIIGTVMALNGNIVKRNGYGVVISGQLAGDLTTMTANDIMNNTNSGVEVDQCHGEVIIHGGNTLKDNGSTSGFAGVRIFRAYNDQKVVVKGNVFISSANKNATTGQLYAILAVSGGDVAYNSDGWNDNDFIFTGTIDAYPTSASVVPCSWGLDNTSAITPVEIFNDPYHSNRNSKFPSVVLNQDVGQRYRGFASSIPTTGDNLRGDYYVNRMNTTATEMGWVCTTAGSPGTWQTYGKVPTT